VWSAARKRYSPDEKRSVAEWERNFALLFRKGKSGAREDDCVLMGCNQWLNPVVTHTEILSGVGLAGSRSFCCGEPYYRAGMLDRAEEIFRRSASLLSSCRARRLVVFCPACFNMFANVYPKLLGKGPGVELVSLPRWLLTRIKSGKIRLRRKLGMKAWLQKNCHCAPLGEGFHDDVREILSAAGVRVEETKGGGFRCCGLGAGASRQSAADCFGHVAKYLRELPVRDVVSYCNGCVVTLGFAELIPLAGFRVFHLMDVVSMAAGGTPVRKHASRGALLLAAEPAVFASALVSSGFVYLTRAFRRDERVPRRIGFHAQTLHL
ncbi:MAG: (Fe-S)-binding protein, partial [bacterium]